MNFNNMWTCIVCNRQMHASSMLAHLGGRPHARQLAIAGPGAQQQTHPNGQVRIRVRDVQAVYGHVVEIPLHCYFLRSWNTLVTVSDVRRASDQFDGEGILEDIDTQWGMRPEGGAYSWDSD